MLGPTHRPHAHRSKFVCCVQCWDARLQSSKPRALCARVLQLKFSAHVTDLSPDKSGDLAAAQKATVQLQGYKEIKDLPPLTLGDGDKEDADMAEVEPAPASPGGWSLISAEFTYREAKVDLRSLGFRGLILLLQKVIQGLGFRSLGFRGFYPLKRL